MNNDKAAILGGAPALTRTVPEYNSLGPEEVEAAAGVVRSGRLSAFFGSWGPNFFGGPQVRAFEAAWSRRFDVPHAVTVNSATSGLVAAVGACGIGPDDEVIVSPFTMTASASAVRVFGGTPVFADIQADTFNLDPASIEAAITPRTKAIIVVHLGGQPADMDAILALARRHDLRVIEDAAQAPGSLYKGRHAGTIGDVGVFSLNCHKTIQTGEGGVCCTHDARLAARLQLIRNHGEAVVEDMVPRVNADDILGFNFRLGEIESAIGLCQLEKLDRLTAPRQRIARIFDDRLRHLPGLDVPALTPGGTHVYYIYMLRIDERAAGLTRRQVVRALAAEGVEVYEGYCRPLYLQPLYRNDWPGRNGRSYGPGLCPVAERLYERELFYHNYLYEPLLDGFIEPMCVAFEKVWRDREQIAALPDDGGIAIRRA